MHHVEHKLKESQEHVATLQRDLDLILHPESNSIFCYFLIYLIYFVEAERVVIPQTVTAPEPTAPTEELNLVELLFNSLQSLETKH